MQSLIAEGDRTKEGVWSCGAEGTWSDVGIVGDIQTEVHSLRQVLLKYIKAYFVNHKRET
jgi:hypothetical protein